jgi:hypothetical protein
MAQLAQMPANFETLRSEMTQRIDALDAKLATIEAEIAADKMWMQMRSEMLEAAQQACAEEKAGTEVPRLP